MYSMIVFSSAALRGSSRRHKDRWDFAPTFEDSIDVDAYDAPQIIKCVERDPACVGGDLLIVVIFPGLNPFAVSGVLAAPIVDSHLQSQPAVMALGVKT